MNSFEAPSNDFCCSHFNHDGDVGSGAAIPVGSGLEDAVGCVEDGVEFGGGIGGVFAASEEADVVVKSVGAVTVPVDD